VSEEPPESRPAPPPDPDSHPTRVLPPDQDPASPKQRFADRVWSLRAMIAVALASVILGGLGGAALASAGDDHDGRRGPGGFNRGGGPMMPPPGMQQRRGGDGPRGWADRRGMGQRQWKQEGPQGRFPSGVPSPKAKPTPSG
jgi:hypothetical protein